MPDDKKYDEKGFELLASGAEAMNALLAGTGPGGAIIAGILKGVALFLKLQNMMNNEENGIKKALQYLLEQMKEAKAFIEILDQRLDELINDFNLESNRQTKRDLLDYYGEITNLATDLAGAEGNKQLILSIANRTGAEVDKWLREDFDIWRWREKIGKEFVDPETKISRIEPVSILAFSNVPLPFYLIAVMVWLIAREQAVQLGEREKLADDRPRLKRHLDAVSARLEYNKYGHGDTAKPRTIAENIKSRIIAQVHAVNKYPKNRVCNFYFIAYNGLTGEKETGDDFEQVMENDNVLCTLNPELVGSPPLELAMESKSGIDSLSGMEQILKHVEASGSLRPPLSGSFDTKTVHFPATFYIVSQSGSLHWYRNDRASQPGGSYIWDGPKTLNDGWGQFVKVFSGGGPIIYALRQDGILMWQRHNGYENGDNQWEPPKEVASGWQKFRQIVPAGDYVVYGIEPNGTLVWHRHKGGHYGGGSDTWDGPAIVSSGWTDYTKVFASAQGVIFAIRTDGMLLMHRHEGYLTGANEWESIREISTGWNIFREVIATPHGVLYGFTNDGRILWYWYGERKARQTRFGDLRRQAAPHQDRLEGPVEVKRNISRFRGVFALMQAPPPPIR